MRITLIILFLFTFVFEGGEGGSGDYRRYQNLILAPYDASYGVQIPFEFANTYGDSITLTWRISNSRHQATLIYTQAFSGMNLIQKTVQLPASIFDGGPALIQFSAARPGFSYAQSLTIYPRRTFIVQQFQTSFQSSEPLGTLDGLGNIKYYPERLIFSGMGQEQVFENYGRFDFSNAQILLKTTIFRTIEFSNAFLYLQDHPSLSGLPLVSGKRQIALAITRHGEELKIELAPHYVHPKTLRMSATPLAGYVVTQSLFLPLEAYEDLKTHPFQLQLTIVHFHTLMLNYPFIYQGEKPFLGHCWQSQFCVSEYA